MAPRRTFLLLGLCGLLLASSGGADAQVMTRMATTLAAILRYPTFFHDKAVALVGTPGPVAGGFSGLPMPANRTFVVLPRTGEVPQRAAEIRGRLFDIGRFASDDSRLGPLNLPMVVTAVSGDRWPSRETLLVLTNATWTEPPSSGDQSLRAVALTPQAFEGRVVTVRGRFRGRNLLGDLPAWPRQSQWDFVLQAADAALWVVGRRPRGDGFDLSTTNRAHTGRWLEATGRIEIRDDLPVLVAEQLRTAQADADTTEDAEPAPPPPPAPEIVFTAPAQQEAQIATDVVVRFQFSRPMRASSFEGQVQVRYPTRAGVSAPPFSATYRPAPMALELRFEYPLAADTDVEVTLGNTIVSADGVAFAGTTLRFRTATTSVGVRPRARP